MNKINELFDKMWADYIKLNPRAQQIVNLLKDEGEVVVNDHIALRTYNLPQVCVDKVARPFLDSGYVEKDTYEFTEKKLFAKHYEHPSLDLPKVFISELILEEFSPSFQNLIREKVASVDPSIFESFELMVKGCPWELSSKEYESLKEESDYGAWLAAIGYRPNHFTVYINRLKKFSNILELNKFLKEKGFELNASGGEVKGSPELLLEQSSTLADSIEVKFTDKTMTLPSCYFEFAKRYPLSNGEMFQGFVAKSADKIFESTDKAQ
ncbi:MAG: hypothetical protein ACJAS4_001349 [Bacteriovoracaceae bacterium]|jgi:hypothetical protein